MILDEARRYFAEGGWDSGTEGLARRLGVTQPLLFRYFASKEKLIEAIYQEIMPVIDEAGWEAMIGDRSRPLAERLTGFYREYFHRVLKRDNFRLFKFAALARYRHGMRYFPLLRKRLFPAIALELRAHRGDASTAPPSATELEIVQTLHASIYHLAVRRWIYTPPLTGDIDALIALKVAVFLDGAVAVAATLPRPPKAAARADRELVLL